MTTPPTSQDLLSALNTVLDPELHVGIVDLGLIYDAQATIKQTEQGEGVLVHVVMTLTTPGCPLAGMFDGMLRTALKHFVQDAQKDITIELTFDPPWVIEMMNPETRAQLNLD